MREKTDSDSKFEIENVIGQWETQSNARFPGNAESWKLQDLYTRLDHRKRILKDYSWDRKRSIIKGKLNQMQVSLIILRVARLTGLGHKGRILTGYKHFTCDKRQLQVTGKVRQTILQYRGENDKRMIENGEYNAIFHLVYRGNYTKTFTY